MTKIPVDQKSLLILHIGFIKEIFNQSSCRFESWHKNRLNQKVHSKSIWIVGIVMIWNGQMLNLAADLKLDKYL
jgi:hypothetical protein